ncbi:hypothetical protein FB451DRAFT_1407396 [Mycena latifolia]|nr:hypothetical protein FB451DRAFT_1407396 [Mycena latifolia]
MDIDLSTLPTPKPELTRSSLDGRFIVSKSFNQAETPCSASHVTSSLNHSTSLVQPGLLRVSRYFLAARSPVFKHMLALPTSKDADMMDGCPFLRLPDNAEDITVFLKALLYYEFFEPFPAPRTYAIIAGVLRMSHEYEVDALRKRALIHLSSIHPTGLAEWDLIVDESWLHDTNDNGVFLNIIPVARQTFAHWILLIAFYAIIHKKPTFPAAENFVLPKKLPASLQFAGDPRMYISPATTVQIISPVLYRTSPKTLSIPPSQFLYHTSPYNLTPSFHFVAICEAMDYTLSSTWASSIFCIHVDTGTGIGRSALGFYF